MKLMFVTFILLAHSAFASIEVKREFIPHPKDKIKKIEYFWAKPNGDGPFPVLVTLHGHQEAPSSGARVYQDRGILSANAELGYVSLAISQTGYGESEGAPDFCGVFTQEAVLAVIEKFKKEKFVNSKKIGIEGVSRGAIVASMVITRDQTIAGAILYSGSYDLEDSLPRLKKIAETNSQVAGMLENIKREISLDTEPIKNRSAIYHVNKIKTPLLIINGALDDRTFPDQALKLAKNVSFNGVEARAVVYPEHGHNVPYEIRKKETIPFLQKYLKGEKDALRKSK